MYATKRRRRNVKTYKHQPKENQKTNPSKRHRERLNGELENLANLLPFEQTILTKLDKLSILRLAVSYLRIKSYFQVSLKIANHIPLQDCNRNKFSQQLYYLEPNFSEGNEILESLNGFILIANSNSEVFYASRTVEQYLGFHQSDIIHQSIYELIHSEDREEFKKQLSWNSNLPADKCDLTLNDLLTKKEYSKYLNRNFTVRFRCLLDNTSGFVTLDIVGHLGVLYGQRCALPLNNTGENNLIQNIKPCANKNKHTKILNNSNQNIANGHNNRILNELDNEHPILALFAVACPFGPPSLFELPNRESLFKTKHKVNLAPLSLDSRGKTLLGYNDQDLNTIGGYDLVHPDDLKYYYNAHKELLKTGSAGLVCYRLMTKSEQWQWLQSSMRIIYKSNKPECVIANHRPLTPEEGEELYYKRGVEFKLPYPCLYDFETNFGGLLNNYTKEELRFGGNSTNTITNKQHAKVENSLLTLNNNITFGLTQTQTAKTTKATKGTKRKNQSQQAHHVMPTPLQTNENNLTYTNSIFDPTQMSVCIPPPPPPQANDYSNGTDYHYSGYFNTLNGYTNYTNYINDSNKLYNSAYQNGFLYNHTGQMSTPQVQENINNSWFDNSTASNSFASSKLMSNNYSLLANTNYQPLTASTMSNTTTPSTSSSYNEIFNSTNAKYANGTYMDDYSNSNPNNTISQFVSNTAYDYNLLNKYNAQACIVPLTKQNTSNFVSDINNNNNGHQNNLKAKSSIDKSLIKPILTTPSSSSSSSSPCTPSENKNYTTSIDTSSSSCQKKLLLANSYNNINKNSEKNLSTHVHDRNSLSSYSTSSCSSASSSISNCGEDTTKFIKQENCIVDLPILNPNNIRSGFIKDYYNDISNYYSNDVNI